jgi:triacylglycerol lipase
MLINSGTSKFNLERAKELLLLVENAHQEFDEAQKRPENNLWHWDQDKETPLGLNTTKKDYKVIKRFGFGEFFLSFPELIKADIRERVPFGFVAQKNNDIFVVFRGTSTPPEWAINFQFKPGNIAFFDKTNLGQVHRGFHKIYTRKDPGENLISTKDDLPPMKDDIETALKQCPKTAQVYVTGHSLGGALATLATLHIQQMNYFDHPPILYAFANPRVGDKTFAKHFTGLECFRIANSEDIVPTVPLASVDLVAKNPLDTVAKALEKAKPVFISSLLPDLDYHHVGEPIYFTLHKGTIADNHVIPAYKEALGIPK